MIAALLLVVMVSRVMDFVERWGGGDLRTSAADLLNAVLLVLMLVETLHTVGISIRERVLVPEPFLIVGLIAAIRLVLVLTPNRAPPRPQPQRRSASSCSSWACDPCFRWGSSAPSSACWRGVITVVAGESPAPSGVAALRG